MQTHEATPVPEDWTTGDVTVGGVRLHYARTGGQKPPLVLAHGFSDDGLCWTPVAKALQGQFDVVMVDARGHGLSDAPEQGYNSEQMAHDLAGVIEQLSLQSPIILGHSMGAFMALTFASLYPELPRAILLEDPPARWKVVNEPKTPQAPGSDDWQKRTRDWILGMKNQSREELIEQQRQATPSWSQEELEHWADAHQRLSPNVVNRQGAQVRSDMEAIQRILCPVLLITADTELGAIVSEADAAALQQLIPQLQVSHIAGAGHSIRREQFAAYMKAVQLFLQQLP